MKKLVYGLLIIASSGILASCNNNTASDDTKKAANDSNAQKMDNNQMSDQMKNDAKFATDAASGGMMEVQMGQMALKMGMSQQVKDFGQQMVTDHTQGNNELKDWAAKKNVTLPAGPDNDMQKKMDDMSKKTGKDFDKSYIDAMVDDHKADIDKFQKEANNGNDADLKAWASNKLPMLQHHLQMAQAAQDAMKNNK